MDKTQLIALLDKQREHKVELDGGRSVTFRRPQRAEAMRMAIVKDDKITYRAGIEDVRQHVVGWKGFTEAHLIGDSSIGSSDEVPFDSELWAYVCGDDIDAVVKVAEKLVAVIVEHETKQDAAAKNSLPG